ncbi:MAG: ankyrin repeat domain-containing protein [Pontiellaceae bacterium]|nr:ankyrin repeat domain-containing protein [Pontiellaceae bacterium]
MKKLFSLLVVCFIVSCKHVPSNNELTAQKLTDAIWSGLCSESGISLDQVDKYLKAGADPNLLTPTNDGYLLLWAIEKQDEDLVLLLLKFGADPNKSENGSTPLHWACALPEKHRLKVVQALVEYGADINARDDVGATPLHWAANGRFDCVEYLLSINADINIKSITGQTILDVAKHYSDVYGVDPVRGFSIYEFMLKRIDKKN